MTKLDITRDKATVGWLLEALASSQAGICLCDEHDVIRYANSAYRNAFFPDLPDIPTDFVTALAAAISSGHGIKLQTMPLGDFIPRVKARRKHGDARYDFTVDMVDGSWWSVNDLRLPNGWTIVVATDISSVKNEEFKLREAHAAAVKAASTDVLTGIPNRRSGLERAEAALTEFRTNRLPLTLAILDIDHFKLINDTFGHVTGDDVIVHFTQSITRRMSGLDHLSRLGGEEFLLVMSNTPTSRAEARLERLIRNLPPLPENAAHLEIAYTFSAGLAAANPLDELKTLLSRADMALYSAKASGRRRIAVSGEISSHVA